MKYYQVNVAIGALLLQASIPQCHGFVPLIRQNPSHVTLAESRKNVEQDGEQTQKKGNKAMGYNKAYDAPSADEHAAASLLNKVASKKIARSLSRSVNKSSSTSSMSNQQNNKVAEMLAKTAQRLAQMEALQKEDMARFEEEQRSEKTNTDDKTQSDEDGIEQERQDLIESYTQQSANALKAMLQRQKVSNKGRKPDLAARLAELDLIQKYPNSVSADGIAQVGFRDDVEMQRVPKDELVTATAVKVNVESDSAENTNKSTPVPTSFSGISPLSGTAGRALKNAGFDKASPIQQAAIPAIFRDDESVILHAETGSGKTLAYLLPITEKLWAEAGTLGFGAAGEGDVTVIMTPTRELATQVAGVASVLAPPGTVRLITQPSNLMQTSNDVSNEEYGGRKEAQHGNNASRPRIIVGSAKSIQFSLYGDGKMPAAPTPKPLAWQATIFTSTDVTE
jgi:hypothetical protein